MIDGSTYRLSEALARRQIPTWELAQIHHVPFETQGFPQQINSTQELQQIMNIMHDHRFDAFVREWNGLSRDDIEELVTAITDYYFMCRTHFPQQQVKLPFSTMIAYFSVYKKLRSYDPNFKTILEVGPGSGNLAFFLKRHAVLESYCSIEACEGYYLLQSLVNQHNFGPHFDERAFPQQQEHAQHTFTRCPEIESPVYADVDIAAKSTHYPWWHLGELAERENYFDIVTSNANLMEMTHRALADYLALHKRVLKDDGILFCQCLGGPVYKSVHELLDFMKQQGYGALALTSETQNLAVNVYGASQSKYTCTRNGVFVTEKHPLYEQAVQRMQLNEPSIAEDNEALISMFFDNAQDKRIISTQEIERRVIKRINATLSQQTDTVIPSIRVKPENTQVNMQTPTRKNPFQAGIENRLWKRLPVIIDHIARQGYQRIALYGNGSHTQLLFEQWNELQGPAIAGIMVTEQSTPSVLQDIPVIAIQDAKNAGFEAIILSSHLYELAMYQACERELPGTPVYFIHNVAQNQCLLTQALQQSLLSDEPFRIVDGGAIDMLATRGVDYWSAIAKDKLELYAFEPNEQECEALSKDAQELGYDLKSFPIALWNKDGRETLYTIQDRAGASLFEPDVNPCKNFYNNRGLIAQCMTIHDTRNISTRALDSLQREGALADIDFIKLNVEGAEKRVLEGAEQVLQHVIGLEINMSFYPTRMGAPLFADVDPLLRELGFEFVDVLSINRYSIHSSRITYPALSTLVHAHNGNAQHYSHQAVSGHCLYFRKMERRTFEQDPYLRRIKCLKLACLQEMYGHIDASLATLQCIKRELSDEERAAVDGILTTIENWSLQLGFEKQTNPIR